MEKIEVRGVVEEEEEDDSKTNVDNVDIEAPSPAQTGLDEFTGFSKIWLAKALFAILD